MTTSITGSSYVDTLTKQTTAAQQAATKQKSTIDQAGFLKLLTAQMTHQDPTAPTDNNQMVAQMASFSQLSGITEMNSSMKSMASDVAASRFGSASGWIGRPALVASTKVEPLSNGSYAGQITLPKDASAVSIAFVDSKGEVVRNVDLGEQKAGAVSFSWDGKDNDGKAVTSDTLTMKVTAVGDGKKLDASTAAWTTVQSVQSPTSGATKLVTGVGSFAPADVIELS